MTLVKKVLKPIMYRAGKENQDYYSGLFKWISQTVQGIKEVKITCKEQYFVDEYRKCGQGYVKRIRRETARMIVSIPLVSRQYPTTNRDTTPSERS